MVYMFIVLLILIVIIFVATLLNTPWREDLCIMIVFNIIYCLVIIVFIAIIIYAYKKYKQPIIELVDTIKTIYNILSKFKITNEETTNNLAKSINIINKNNSDISKKLSDISKKFSDIKSIVATNIINNANTYSKNKAKNSSSNIKKDNTKDVNK